MIKRTLYFGSPAYLSKKNQQLFIQLPEAREVDQENDNREESGTINDKYKTRSNVNTIPIEDIGSVILDNLQITITQGLLTALLENNVAVISCGHTHLPEGLFLPLSGNSVQSQMFQNQISAKNALKKQLWKQTVTAKIINQYKVLEKCSRQADTLKRLSRKVTSGDKENLEAQAAAYYWKQLFPEEIEFERDRDGAPPNNLLNYGYAILRGIVARSLVSSGLLPTLGIHHHNKYNAYCLADDIMEPYRPFVDDVVIKLFLNLSDCSVLDTAIKKELLSISTLAVTIDGETGPLLVMMHRTTASLAKCFSGLTRKLAYPVFEST